MRSKIWFLVTVLCLFTCGRLPSLMAGARAQPSDECGLLDICQTPGMPTMLADGDPPPDECGLLDICQTPGMPTMLADGDPNSGRWAETMRAVPWRLGA
jgi:hypothetical protein